MPYSNYADSSRRVRSLTQNISLLAIFNETNGQKSYIIKGPTGNTYKVIIDENPTCTCEDFERRHSKFDNSPR